MIKPNRWEPADGLSLEPNAITAVKEIKRSVALTAGPGAGKTELLAQRADFLLRTGACPYPQRILAISFKVDASRNLKRRVCLRCGADLGSRFDSHTFHAFAKRLVDRFRPVLTGEDALDPNYTIGDVRYGHSQITFGELVPFAVDILKLSDVARNAVRQTYSHVFLDEFQDCTNSQFSLIRAAFEETDILLTAVGDTKQRIMGWAGALEGIFKKFADQFGALGLNLYQNFRSAPRLRRIQNAMIKVMEPKAALKPAEIQGAEGEIDVLPFDDNYQEAEAVADLIQGWIQNDGLPPAEIGILVPRQVEEYAELLMAELEARGIPFRNEQNLQDLSVEPIARVIVDFLLVIFGDREPDAYARLMDTVAMTSNDDEGERRSRFQQYVDEERTKQNGGGSVDADSITTMIREVVRRLGPEAVLSLSSEYEQGAYLKQVIEQTVDRVHTLWKSTNELVAALTRFSEDRSVRIMTIHKSKGLEFHSVIMLAIENETYWAEATTERSVFFVGISRAKQRLLLTWSKQRPTPRTKPRRWNTARTPYEEFLGYADTP